MPATDQKRFRTLMTAAIALAHTNLALLGIIGRLNYSTPSSYELLREIVANPAWTIAHAAAAVLLTAALVTHRHQAWALSVSVGVMGFWAFLTLIWGLSTDPPVSLVTPTLGGALATLAWMLALSWARTETRT